MHPVHIEVYTLDAVLCDDVPTAVGMLEQNFDDEDLNKLLNACLILWHLICKEMLRRHPAQIPHL